MAIDSFILYKSQCETILKLTDLEAGIFFKNVLNYQISGKIPEFQNTYEQIIWDLFQNQFEIDSKKWEETKSRDVHYGSKGGKKSAELRKQRRQPPLENIQPPLEKHQQSLENFNLNVNANVNANVNENDFKKEEEKSFTGNQRVISEERRAEVIREFLEGKKNQSQKKSEVGESL